MVSLFDLDGRGRHPKDSANGLGHSEFPVVVFEC